jgi:ABC-type Co2+ transport system permease subunit
MWMFDDPGLRWGLSLIVLTIAIHAAAVVMMAFVGVRIRGQLETRRLNFWSLIAIMICLISAIGLLSALLHGIECGIWAAAYLSLGALDSPADALLYSLDSMSTRGASGLMLHRPWQIMGALEAVDGMLLFGVSAAFIFAVMQVYWSMFAAQVTPRTG